MSERREVGRSEVRRDTRMRFEHMLGGSSADATRPQRRLSPPWPSGSPCLSSKGARWAQKTPRPTTAKATSNTANADAFMASTRYRGSLSDVKSRSWVLMIPWPDGVCNAVSIREHWPVLPVEVQPLQPLPCHLRVPQGVKPTTHFVMGRPAFARAAHVEPPSSERRMSPPAVATYTVPAACGDGAITTTPSRSESRNPVAFHVFPPSVERAKSKDGLNP